jgi:opacity protein-like surface antigen
MSAGIAGFISNDFGGGFSTPEININDVRIPSIEQKMPWSGGGIKVFFDFVYIETGLGITFGGGTTQYANPSAEFYPNEPTTIDVERSFTALNFSLLGKYPIEITDNMLIFPAAGIDYMLVLSGKNGETDIVNADDDSAMWFKFGIGMDIAVSKAMFIRPMLLYGVRQSNKWERSATKPIMTDGESGETLVGHGFTFSVGIGFGF